MDKPTLEKGAVTEKVAIDELVVTLLRDHERFSNGLLTWTSTNATFQWKGEQCSVGIDMGGTILDVSIGRRGWKVDIKDIVSAVLEADEAYLARPENKLAGN